MLILGIDPGTTRVGYGLVKKERGELKLVKSGLLKIKSRGKGARLFELDKSFCQLIKSHRPELAALEKLYFVKNQKTGLEVAEARGVLILNLIKSRVPFMEFSPSQVKAALTNYGRADKKAVAEMCAKILKIGKIKALDDVSDALAIAITASNYPQNAVQIEQSGGG